MSTAVEVRGRWPRVSGEPSNRVILKPDGSTAPGSLLIRTGGLNLLSYTSENKDVPECLVLDVTADVKPATTTFSPQPQAIARITYGYGKATNVVWVDLNQGFRVTLPASIVDVSLLYLGGGGGSEGPIVGPTMEVSGALAYGSASESTATLTYYNSAVGTPAKYPPGVIGAGIEVPPKARRVTVYADSGNQGLFDVLQYFSTSGSGLQPSIVDQRAPGNGPILLAGATNEIRVRNTDTVSHNYVFVYHLVV